MAFNVVANSRFKPFSYQEMLLPVLMADLELKNIEASLSELNTKASVWDNMANLQTDPKAYKMYKDYSSALLQLSDAIAAGGLTADSRRSMLDLRNRYASDIVPIELAYTRRRELSDELRKMRALNPSVIYDRDMTTTSLDDLIANPNLAPLSISGALLTLLVGLAASNLKKQMQDDLLNNPSKANEWRKVLGGQYYERIIRDGFSQLEVMNAMQGRGPKVLTDLVNNVVGSSGVQSWNNPQALLQAMYYANQGLYNAIGDYKIDTRNNKEWDLQALLRMANARLKLAELASGRSATFYRGINSTKIDGKAETTKINDDVAFMWRVARDPKLLNQALVRSMAGGSSLYGGVSSGNFTTYPNRDRYNAIVAKYKTNNIHLIRSLADDEIKQTAERSRAFIPNLSKFDNMIEMLNLNATSAKNPLYIREYNKGKIGNTVDPDDYQSKVFTEGSFVTFEPEDGVLLHSKDKDGKISTYLLDSELYDDRELTMKSWLNSIKEAYKNKDFDNAALYIRSVMGKLNDFSNTRMKVQGDTSSKDSETLTNPSDYYIPGYTAPELLDSYFRKNK